jgi:protein-tyrosine phosphatase
MIDTHLHILPGVDDGPESIEEALALAKVLVHEGVHTAIATPHYNDLFQQRSAAEIKERVNELQQEFDHQHIPLQLLSGHEAQIKPGLVEDIQAGRLSTLNDSHYLLLELWNQSLLPEMERVIFELRAFGITPILAHPERYCIFQQEPERAESLLKQGVLLQITASSLIGMQGRTAQRTAKILLKRKMIHCIASDAHGLYRRSPAILKSLDRATQVAGQVSIKRFTEDWPMIIINDMHVEH